MENTVVLAVVIYGLALFGWGALCFLVGKYALWPFVKGLNEGLNGGLDEDEQYENELLSSMNRFQAKHDELVVRVDGVELHSNENDGNLKSLNARVVELEKMHSFYEKKFDKIYANLKGDNDSISELFKRLSHMKDAANNRLHERLLKVEEYTASVDESKYKISSRLNQLERQHENLTIQFATHRESFKLLLDALEGAVLKKKSVKGKSK